MNRIPLPTPGHTPALALLIVALAASSPPGQAPVAPVPAPGSPTMAAPARPDHGGPRIQSGTLAAWAAMSESQVTTGSAYPMALLYGAAPPLLGGVASLKLLAPTYDFAVVVESLDALPAGVPLGGAWERLTLHIRPDRVINSFVVGLDATGQGTLPLPLPPDSRLTGMTLAWQAVAFRLPGQFKSSTNLVLANLGTQTTGGVASYPQVFTGQIRIGRMLSDPYGNGRPIYINVSGGHSLRIAGTYKAPGIGTIGIFLNWERWLQVGAIPSGKTSFDITVYVPPARPDKPVYLNFWNHTSSDVELSWSIERSP